MNFQQFVHEVTDVILTLNKDKIYVNSTLHVGRNKCKYFDSKNKEFKMNVHHDFKWLPVEELETLDWAPADVPIVNKILGK